MSTHFLFLFLILLLVSCKNKGGVLLNDKPTTEHPDSSAPKKIKAMHSDSDFELLFSRHEQSKDSNKQQQAYSLSGNRLTKTYQSSGRRAKPKESKSVDLSIAQIETLKTLLQELNLTEAYQKSYAVAEDGMTISYKTGFKTAGYQISIEGGKEQENDVQFKHLQRFAAKLDTWLIN